MKLVSISYLPCVVIILLLLLLLLLLLQEPTDITSKEKNEVGVCQRLVCQKREFAERSSSCEV